MTRKRPSSLDYETLLHELSLKGFQRAVRERDLGRALSYAGKLAESTDRFWRWQGLLDLSTAHLLMGRASSALLALDQARGLYRDVPRLRTPVDEQKACVLLELGRADETVELARGSSEPSLLLLYLADLAAGKKSRARALDRLREASAAAPELATPAEVYLLAGTASDFFERGDLERALHHSSEITESEAAALAAPICFVRAFAWKGRILDALGNPSGARSAWTNFLTFWEGGELAPELLSEARAATRNATEEGES